HCLGRGPVRNPPVRRVAGVAVLDEIHLRKVGIAEDLLVPEVIIRIRRPGIFRSATHGLENQRFPHLLDDFIQREERITQVIENSHEEDVVELPREGVDFVDRALFKLDWESERLRCESRLVQITIVHIDAEHAFCPALLHLDGIKPAVASDVEHRRAAKVGWDCGLNMLPLDIREVAEKMVWCSAHTVEVEIMKPLAELSDAAREYVAIDVVHPRRCHHEFAGSRAPVTRLEATAGTHVAQPQGMSTFDARTHATFATCAAVAAREWEYATEKIDCGTQPN